MEHPTSVVGLEYSPRPEGRWMVATKFPQTESLDSRFFCRHTSGGVVLFMS